MTPLHQCRTKLIEELIQPSDSEAFWSSSKGNATKKKFDRSYCPQAMDYSVSKFSCCYVSLFSKGIYMFVTASVSRLAASDT